ncbi:S8 family peptidase [Streptomyces armeniacus]|nr:S8 family peptidase [Streptomyces armeniacus]
MTKKHLLRAAAVATAAAAVALPPHFSPAHATPAAGTGERGVHVVQIHGTDATEEAVTRRAEEMTADNGGELRRVYHSALQGFSVSLTEAEVDAYLRDARVSSVTGDRTYEVAARPSRPAPHGPHRAGTHAPSPPPRDDGGTQPDPPSWGLDRLDQTDLPLDASYTYPGDAAGTDVYVLDTGVRVSHAEFGGRARAAYDAVEQREGGRSGTDCHGHGTAMAATAAGSSYGAAKQAGIASVRAFRCDGTATMEHLMTAVDWITTEATASGRPAVVNLGFSGPPGSVLDLQLYEMTVRGVAYTAAAGNGDADGTGGDACDVTPARQTTAITVAATGPDDTRPKWSNHGSCAHLFAPGTDIVTAGACSDTARTTLTGTSAAAAETAGVAAMHLAGHPEATPRELDAALIAAATKDRVRDPGEGSGNNLLHTVPAGSATTDDRRAER